VGGDELGQHLQAAPVLLHRDHLAAGALQQRAGKPAGAGADLHDVSAGEVARLAYDAARQVEVEQEVLAKRLRGTEAVPANGFGQRRQVAQMRISMLAARRRSRM
jgi:hypothetical protein